MLIVKEVNENIRLKLPENYADLGLMDKLRINRSEIPAITHVDFFRQNTKLWMACSIENITN